MGSGVQTIPVATSGYHAARPLGLHFSGRRILFFGQPLCELCFGIGQNVYGEQKDGIFLDDDFYFCTAIV
jgi:hypothetical protein